MILSIFEFLYFKLIILLFLSPSYKLTGFASFLEIPFYFGVIILKHWSWDFNSVFNDIGLTLKRLTISQSKTCFTTHL